MPLAERILAYGQHFPNALRSPARAARGSARRAVAGDRVRDARLRRLPRDPRRAVVAARVGGVRLGERARAAARAVRCRVPRVRSRARAGRRAARHRAPRAARAPVRRRRRARTGSRSLRRQRSRGWRGASHAPAAGRRRAARDHVGRRAARRAGGVVERSDPRGEHRDPGRARSRGPPAADRVGRGPGPRARPGQVGARAVRAGYPRAPAPDRARPGCRRSTATGFRTSCCASGSRTSARRACAGSTCAG